MGAKASSRLHVSVRSTAFPELTGIGQHEGVASFPKARQKEVLAEQELSAERFTRQHVGVVLEPCSAFDLYATSAAVF